MTPSQRNNKHYPPETSGSGMSARKASSTATTTGFRQSQTSTAKNTSVAMHHQHELQRYDNFSQNNNNIMRDTKSMVKEQQQHHQHYYHQHQQQQQQSFRSSSSSNHSETVNQKTSHKSLHKINRNDEFIPLFVLVDASKEDNERKVREICRKLMLLDVEEGEPVVNFQDQTGRTALSYGCGSANLCIIEEISRLRCTNPNLVDNDGNAPLHYSSVCGHLEGVDFLLRRYNGVIDVNVRNTSGLTPLMKAALQGRTRCAKRLLIAGASPLLKDHIRGFTAAEWARLTGRHMCEDLINRSAIGLEEDSESSSLPYTLSNVNEEHDRKRLMTEELSYYHQYARSTVRGAKWLKNKIKKVLGASVRSGEDKSYVYDNPLVKSLADQRLPDKHFPLSSNLGLSGAGSCAGTFAHDKQTSIRKMPIPQVQITPVRR